MNLFRRLLQAGRLPDPTLGRVDRTPEHAAATDVPSANELTIQTDRPIETAAEDRFDRAAFAGQIANVVARRQDSSSLVVGLYGPWGDGKTSVLAMIRESLAAFPEVIRMDYNPWFYGSSTESITRGFFKSLAATLEAEPALSEERVGKLMETLGSAVPHLGKAISELGKTLATADLARTRDQVGQILKRHNKKIVVFIDDIDRLDKSDIQTLFKLVRLSGGFDRTTYILAFDDVVVADALGAAYGAGDRTAGRRFLEKIIQVPLHLPPAQPETLRRLMFSACDRVVRENGLELPEGQNVELGNGLVSAFGAALKTPRQIKLFDNAISFAIPLLKGEVRVVDQVLIEALRIFYPSVYQSIRHHPESVLQAEEAPATRDQRAPNPVQAAILSSDVPEPEREALKRLLKDLFPRTGAMGYGDSWEATCAAEKRICSSAYFERYFSYAVLTGDIPDRDVTELIDRAAAGDDAAVGALVEGAMARDAAQPLVRKLRSQEDSLPIGGVRSIVLAVSAKAGRFPVTGDIFFGDYALVQAAVLVSHLVSRLNPGDQDAVLLDVVDQADSLHFAQQVVRFSRSSEDENGKRRGFLSADRAEPLAASLFRRLKDAADRSSLFDAEGRLGAVLYGIEANASLGLKRDLRSYLAKILAVEPGNAVKFLKAFSGRSQSGSGPIGVSDFSRGTYEAVAGLLDPDLVFAQLKAVYGGELDSAVWREGWRGSGEVDRRIAHQFAFLHLNPTASFSSDASGHDSDA